MSWIYDQSCVGDYSNAKNVDNADDCAALLAPCPMFVDQNKKWNENICLVVAPIYLRRQISQMQKM